MITITEKNPVYTHISDSDPIREYLRYQGEYWRPGPFSKEKKTYQASLVKNGYFLSGFQQRVFDYLDKRRIGYSFSGSEYGIEIKAPKLEGIEFRQDQQEAIKEMANAHRGVWLAPTGSGKTLLICALVEAFQTPALIIVHTTDLFYQTIKELERFFGKVGIVGDMVEQIEDITVAMIQTISRRKFNWDGWGMVIVDECFKEGTKIRSLKGEKRIEEIRIGDLVCDSKGQNRVINVFRNRISVNEIIKLRLSNGKEIVCTKGHLFFSEDSWIKADKILKKPLLSYSKNNIMMVNIILFILTVRRVVYGKAGKVLSYVWEKVFCSRESEEKKILLSQLPRKNSIKRERGTRMSSLWENLLLYYKETAKILFSKVPRSRSGAKQEIFGVDDETEYHSEGQSQKKNERKQSYVRSKSLSKDDKHKKNKWNPKYLARKAWRKWKIYSATAPFSYCFGMAHGIACESWGVSPGRAKENRRISYQLQGRYRKQEIENSYRNRWEDAQKQKNTISGQKKGRQTRGIRVDSIEIYERGSAERFGIGDQIYKIGDQEFIDFYDLEVENSHSYFAENILVHNCHHVNNFKGMYAKVLQEIKAPVRFGFTATLPKTEMGLMALEGLIGPVVGKTEYEELQEKEVLAKPRIRIYRVPESDRYKDLKGGYKAVYEQGIVQNRKRNALIVEKARELIDGGLTVLVMVERVEHGDILFDMAEAVAPGAFCFLHGSTSKEIRAQEKWAFEEQERKGVIATRIWAEGVNIKSIGCVINAVGGESEIATIQRFGRGLRRTEEKDEVILIDFFDTNHHWFLKHSGLRICSYMDWGWM